MRDLCFLDNLTGTSGYAKSSRELYKALTESNVVCKTPTQLAISDIIYGRAVFHPLHQYYGKHPIISQVTLESSILHEAFVNVCNQDFVNQVWCPCERLKRIYYKSGVIKDKIHVIPHGFDPEIYHPLPRNDSPSFTFLFVGGYTGKGDRKGADILCQAFNDEFKNDKDVKLYLKINGAYGTNKVNELQELTKDVSDRVTINTMNLSEQEMAQLYNMSDAFVCPSHGEGFNIPALEAAACGKPVLATDWGVGDFLNVRKNNCIYDFDWVPARYTPWDCGLWQEPNTEQLKRYMRVYTENREEYAAVGRDNLKDAQDYKWSKIAELAIATLKNI